MEFVRDPSHRFDREFYNDVDPDLWVFREILEEDCSEVDSGGSVDKEGQLHSSVSFSELTQV